MPIPRSQSDFKFDLEPGPAYEPRTMASVDLRNSVRLVRLSCDTRAAGARQIARVLPGGVICERPRRDAQGFGSQ